MKPSLKSSRLRNSRQFRRVYDQGYRFHTPYFSAFILRKEDDEQRYGITVTRKIGGAVLRNRCKRRLREVMRNHTLNQSCCSAGFDLVLNVKAGMAEADFKQLQESFSYVMNKVCDYLKKQ